MKKILAKLALTISILSNLAFINIAFADTAKISPADEALINELVNDIEKQEKACKSLGFSSCDEYQQALNNQYISPEDEALINELVDDIEKQEKACKILGYSSCDEYQQAIQKSLDFEADFGTNPIEDAQKAPCVDELGIDNGYIITIIEEPLVFEEYGEAGKDDKISRTCFRNSFSYVDALNQRQSITELSKKCSPTALAAFNDKSQREKYQITFSCQEVQVLLNKGGTSALENYIMTLYRWAASVVGLVAVVIIIGSGIQISASGGDPEVITKAKDRIVKSLSGIALLFLSGVILYTINPTFFT
ncbi:hypothetical protein COU74_04600 [Candidatus Peregrinibacteria bacterium CG10_big_fil_rev_8_21_14_0_10_36_19]|nr:MAG: hypothetical protein COU74_04600 [Candidatus Peregrinibacteria bacterium CG10_big_fil_rev_8_21_14_0_10_36_19]